jgi:hypothetical protein
MDTQKQSMKGARTLVLGMLAGASIVAGGLVLARGHTFSTQPAAIIQSDAAQRVGHDGSARQISAEVPTVELTRALVVGGRLKILVSSEQDSTLILASSIS